MVFIIILKLTVYKRAAIWKWREKMGDSSLLTENEYNEIFLGKSSPSRDPRNRAMELLPAGKRRDELSGNEIIKFEIFSSMISIFQTQFLNSWFLVLFR